MDSLVNLHVHFSAFVPFDRILAMFKTSKFKNYLYFENNQFIIKDMPNNYNLFNNLQNKYNNTKVKTFDDLHILGNMFYGIIKNKYFWEKYYIKEIIRQMKKQKISYIEFRLRLGTVYYFIGNVKVFLTIDEELKILDKYNKYFSIISSMNKSSKPNIVDKHLSVISNMKYKVLKGFDLLGNETRAPNLRYMYKVLNKYKINYYFHAGEILNDKGIDNVLTAIKLNSKRIGHGIAVLNDSKIMKEIENKKIFLEICPISNKILFNVEPNIKMIEKYINNIVIGSDDDNKLNCNLKNNLDYLIKTGLTCKHIDILVKNAQTFTNQYNIN